MDRAATDRPSGAVEPGPVAALGADVIELQLRADRGEISTARHAVAGHLVGLGLPQPLVDDLELVTSELVTNAIIHPKPVQKADAVRVRVAVTDDVEMSVSNVGSAASIPPVEAWQPADPGAISGRGLGIVRRLCDEVAVDQRGDLAVVSCRRHLPEGGARR